MFMLFAVLGQNTCTFPNAYQHKINYMFIGINNVAIKNKSYNTEMKRDVH